MEQDESGIVSNGYRGWIATTKEHMCLHKHCGVDNKVLVRELMSPYSST